MYNSLQLHFAIHIFLIGNLGTPGAAQMQEKKNVIASMWNYSLQIVEKCFKGCSCVECFGVLREEGIGWKVALQEENTGKNVRQCEASGRTAVSNLRIKEKFHEYVRPGAGQQKSYRNRAEPLSVIEPELSNFTFERLCFPPVAACAGSASANPLSCTRGGK